MAVSFVILGLDDVERQRPGRQRAQLRSGRMRGVIFWPSSHVPSRNTIMRVNQRGGDARHRLHHARMRNLQPARLKRTKLELRQNPSGPLRPGSYLKARDCIFRLECPFALRC